jgi:dCTP deaminase
MVLSDFDLKAYIASRRLVVEPLEPEIIRENGIDFRFTNKWKILKDTDKVFDLHNPPSNVDEFYEEISSDRFVLQRRQTVLVGTIERIEMPSDVMGFCNLRSTYARLGISIPPTIIDATWRGHLTISITATRYPVVLHTGDRFLHVIFAKLTSPVQKPYDGKYQDQTDIALPKPDPEYLKNLQQQIKKK